MTKCWILTEQGLKGTQNQCLALAHAAGLEPEIKTIKLKNPWKIFTPWIKHFTPNALAKGSSELTAPNNDEWPDLLIAAGRKAIAPALWIKQQSGGRAKLVVLLNPGIKDENFDLVIVPQHDAYDGANVLKITGALSLITPETLAAAKTEFASILEPLPAPRIAVLIGGTSRTHKIVPKVARLLTMQLKKLLQQDFSLMITASRRTPVAIQEQLQKELQSPRVQFWDGNSANPYQAYLAWADAILVTEDSVSMACEAISTGKPVYIIRLSGGSKRFKRFHDYLINQGFAKWFTGQINDWSYTPPDDLAIAAEAVRKILT
jgi:mitochondrial fission protein ELM1